MEAKARIKHDPPTATQEAGLDFLGQMLKVRQEATEAVTKLETAIDKMGKAVVPDAHAPAAMAQKAETVGTNKGKLNTLSTVLLGILAGVFIGLGAMFCTVVTTSSGLGFGLNKLVGGLAFCLGLILVVVAGAELFTGNTLIVMSWMSGRTSLGRLLRNWGLVYFANLAGALSLAGLMYYTNQWTLSGNALGANALLIANSKVNLTFVSALTRGILCNALVCLAVWLCFSARSVVDKIMAIVFPITAFVAAGFEHSIANMYFIPMGILLTSQPAVLEAAKVTADGVANLTWMGFVGNLIPVTIGNIIGGSLLIGVIYWLAYLRDERIVEMATTNPFMKTVVAPLCSVKVQEPTFVPLAEPIRIQIDELIRTKLEEPALLDRGGKALLAVLARAKNDNAFLASLAQNASETLKAYDLTPEEKAAISSGDVGWIESKLGPLDKELKTWLMARLGQEKW